MFVQMGTNESTPTHTSNIGKNMDLNNCEEYCDIQQYCEGYVSEGMALGKYAMYVRKLLPHAIVPPPLQVFLGAWQKASIVG